MSTDDLPPLEPELEALLAAEREVPSPPAGLEARLFARLGATLGWGGSGGGGAIAGGAGLAKLMMIVAAVVATGAVVMGYVALRGGGHGGTGATVVAGSGDRPTPGRRGPRAVDERSLPTWFGDAARGEIAIAGHVLAQGKPVAGARVVLTSDATRAGLLAPLERQTDARGGFDFGAHRAAVYDVTASAAHAGAGHVRVDTVDPTAIPAPADVTVELPGCADALVGVVRDASGGVIAGAEVTRARGAWGDVTALGLGVLTDATGAYELCTPPGPITAVVRADGYGAMTVLDTVLGRRQRDVELMPAATLVGRVVRAGDGSPVADAIVWLRPWSYQPWLRTTPASAVTDAAGRFRIGGLAPGRHQVVAAVLGGDTPTVPVVLDAGRESAEVVLRLEERGFVIDARVVEAGRSVPGARVFAMAGGRPVGGGRVPTDGGGHLTFRLAAPGPISFALDTHDVVAPAALEVRGPHTDVVIEVASRSAIRGEVRLRGQPVPGAEVSVGGPAIDNPRRTIADGAGQFELRGLPAGRYGLSGQSYAVQAFSSVERSIELPARTTLAGIVLELDGAAAIAGTVVDQDGAPVPQIAVKYTHTTTGDLCRATTGARGEFVCPMMAGGGDYVPLVRLDEASAIALPAAAPGGLTTVHLADGEARVTGVVLRVRLARATLRGRVVDGAGAPYPDVTVRAIEASTGYTPATAPWIGTRTAITDVDGRFALPAWADATYTVHARAPDGAEAAEAGVRPGGAEVVLAVDRPGRIVGTLVGFHRRPAMAVRRLGNTIELATPAIDGDRFVIDGLSAGTYGVMAIHGAEGGAELVEVAAGADAPVTVRAGPPSHLAGRVIDLVTGAPVAGVRCTVAPFLADAGIAWFGTEAPPTDAAGRFELDAPSGSIEVSCRPNPARHSDGAARVTAAVGGTATITIPVVVSPTSAGASNSLGLRLGFAHAPVTGHVLTIVELRPGGSAARAGLRIGDVIVAVDGRDVTGLTDDGLARLFGLHAVGDAAQVTRLRAGVRAVVAVTVEPPWWR